MIRLLICLIFCFMVGCGKVAQDISNLVHKLNFKSVNLIVQHEDFEPFGWDAMPVSTNVVSIYAQAKGLIFEKGWKRLPGGVRKRLLRWLEQKIRWLLPTLIKNEMWLIHRIINKVIFSFKKW